MSAVALAYASEPVSRSRFSDGASQLLDKIDCRPIHSDEERAAVGRLRYEAYLREGAIDPNPFQSFTDSYDDTSNVWIFGFYIGDELASSIRIHVATKDVPVSPSLAVFSDFLQPELEAGKTIVDPTRFVTDHRLSRLYPFLPHVTLRLSWLAAEYFEAEHLLAAVRAEHQALYRRLFRHGAICGPRNYPLLKTPITLMTADYRQVADNVYRLLPFVRSTYFERRMLFERHPLLVPASIPLSPTAGEQLPLFAQAG
jgi:hypothetical protein